MQFHYRTWFVMMLFFIAVVSQAQTLFEAINRGSSAEALALLQNGDSPNVEDEYGQTPLMYAIDHTPDLVPQLLEYGADVNHVTQAGWTPLAYAIRKGDILLVRKLVEAGADTSNTYLIDDVLAQYPNDNVEFYLTTLRPAKPKTHPFLSWSLDTEAGRQNCIEQSGLFNLEGMVVYFEGASYGEFDTSMSREQVIAELEVYVSNYWGEVAFFGRGENDTQLLSLWYTPKGILVVAVEKDRPIYCIKAGRV